MMTAHILLLLLLLAFSAQGDPDSAARRGQHQDALQHHEHVWSLGVRRTHRLLEIIHWIRSASAKEPSGKSSREPQDPYSYGRRRR
ncbi:putative adrenomedullin-5-like protein [Sapajus apella]|uniref:Adrenomedullin-5-like protein n=1 Tax=Sapajus apella TaxID=9515 RepID=A0A6J3GR96_SAPAP|nr:putative adrenomedullin-5-like protein [Sapajus apella]